MEEIVQILIFVGAMVIAVVGQNAKGKKKPMTASPQDVLEDQFPDIEMEPDVTDMCSPQPSAPSVSTPKRTFHKAKARPTPPMTKATPPASSKPTRKISLSTREEARRAFIHSEIFNRKY